MARPRAWEMEGSPAAAPPVPSAAPQWPWGHAWGQGGAQAAPSAAHVAGASASARETDAQVDEAEVAGAELADFILQLHVSGRLTAKDACILSHLAVRAGARGPVQELAFRPSAPTGHFQRHLDSVAGLRALRFHRVPMPSYCKRTHSRCTHDVSVCPPHEALHKEFVESPGLVAQARAAAWPACHAEHPVDQRAGGRSVPLAFYLDGAQYTKTGACVLVFAVQNLVSGARHLCCAVDKRRLCKCGCRGWCSLRPLLQMFAWSFRALATGSFPSAREDGSPWPGAEEERASLAGLPLACGVCAVQQVRGDWAEFAHSLGLPTWRHNLYPCLWCQCERASMFSFGELEEDDCPWQLNTHADYEAACRRCEITVVVRTEAERAAIASALFWDRRQYGSRGRALKRAVPSHGLQAGDRLEPSAGLPDVAGFDDLALPGTVVFWRPSQETLTRHRNPLFDDSIGLNIQSLRVDSLHCLYLGVIQTACGAVIQAMLEHDCFGALAEGCTTVESKSQLGLQRFSGGLQAWFRENRHLALTEVSTEITLPLRVKGAEAKTVLLYMVDMLPGVAPVLPNGDAMVQCLVAMKEHIGCLTGPVVWSRAAQEDCNIGGPSYLQPQSLDFVRQFGSKFGWRVVAFLAHCCLSSSGLPVHPGRGPPAHGQIRPRCPQMPRLAAHGQDQQTTRPLVHPNR